jgi:hypothetical protein
MSTTSHTYRVFASVLAAALSTLAIAASSPDASPLRSDALNSVGAPADVADIDGYVADIDGYVADIA